MLLLEVQSGALLYHCILLQPQSGLPGDRGSGAGWWRGGGGPGEVGGGRRRSSSKTEGRRSSGSRMDSSKGQNSCRLLQAVRRGDHQEVAKLLETGQVGDFRPPVCVCATVSNEKYLQQPIFNI